MISHNVFERRHHFHLHPKLARAWCIVTGHYGFSQYFTLGLQSNEMCLINETKSCIYDWSASFSILFEACFPLHCAHPSYWGVSQESKFVELAYWSGISTSRIDYQHYKYLMYVVIPCISQEFGTWSSQAFIQRSNLSELYISSRYMGSFKAPFQLCKLVKSLSSCIKGNVNETLVSFSLNMWLSMVCTLLYWLLFCRSSHHTWPNLSKFDHIFFSQYTDNPKPTLGLRVE